MYILFAAMRVALTDTSSIYGKAEIAYWAQAIFAFFTIFLALYVVRLQGDHAAQLMIKADERTLRRKIDSVGAVLDEACRQITAIGNEVKGIELIARKKEKAMPILPQDDRIYAVIALSNYQGIPQFANALRLIDQIPMHEMGSQELVQTVLRIRDALATLDQHLLRAWEEGELKFSASSLWNSANIWPEVARLAKQDFDTAAKAIFLSMIDQVFR